MAKFRKKPVVIEATQFKVDDPSTHAHVNVNSPNGPWWIDTLEGPMIVNDSDYIITGVKGEHYACKPDIFALTYDLVE